MLKKSISLKNIPACTAELSDEALTNIQTFFMTYPERDCLVLTRMQPAENNCFHRLNSYFMPNDGNGAWQWAVQMSKIQQQADTYITICSHWAYHDKPASRRVNTIHALDRFVVEINDFNHTPMRRTEAERIAKAMQSFSLPVTAVVYTGMGVQIHFAIQPEKQVYCYQGAYNAASEKLADAVYQFLDKKNFFLPEPKVLKINDSCRLPGSFNTVTFDYVEVLYVNRDHTAADNKPTFDDVMAMLSVKDPDEERADKTEQTRNHGFYGCMCRVYMSLAKAGRIHVGCRNNSLYAFCYNLFACFGEKRSMRRAVWRRVTALNDALADPLCPDEMEELFSQALTFAQPCIHNGEHEYPTVYSVVQQLDWAGVDYAGIPGIPTKEYQAEQHRKAVKAYNRSQSRAKHTVKLGLMKKAYEAFKQLGTKTAVAEKLGIARATVRRYIQAWKDMLAEEHEAWVTAHMAAVQDNAAAGYVSTVAVAPAICMTN